MALFRLDLDELRYSRATDKQIRTAAPHTVKVDHTTK